MISALLAVCVSGPPEPPGVVYRYTAQEHASARSQWKLYAAGWALDVSTTAWAVSRGREEGNPVARLAGGRWRPVVALAVLRGVWAVWQWRSGTHDPRSAKLRARIFLGSGLGLAAWNVSVAW